MTEPVRLEPGKMVKGKIEISETKGILPELPEQPPLHLWGVSRPYCSPGHVIVLAFSSTQAVELTHAKYGFCSDTKAKKLGMRKPRVVAAE